MVAEVNSLSKPFSTISDTHVAHDSKMIRAVNCTKMIVNKIFDILLAPMFGLCAFNTLALSYFGNVSLTKSISLSIGCYIVGMIPSIIRQGFLPLYRMSHAKESLDSKVVKITKENFQTEVMQSTIPVVLDASASWCIPCKKVASIFSEISQELEGKVKFAKFDVDEQKELSEGLKIKVMPTLIFLQDGIILGRHHGMLLKNEIISVINTLWSDLKLKFS